MKINKNDYFQRYTELSVILIQTPFSPDSYRDSPRGAGAGSLPPCGTKKGVKEIKNKHINS
ncbi:MAG: hypothetical protein RBS38_03220 [Bacteroidales bacterium]|jgi:hypothetical protein|nr:hypothetical protein [Bacteroidales bacterium]